MAATHSSVLKVIQIPLGDNDVPDLSKGRVIATIDIDHLPQKAQIRNVRSHLKGIVQASQRFCYPDGSSVSDNVRLVKYQQHVDEETRQEQDSNGAATILRRLYIEAPRQIMEASVIPPLREKEADAEQQQAPTQGQTPVHTAAILTSGKKFLIVVSEWEAGGDGEGGAGSLTSRGSLQSTAFSTAELSKLTLSRLRHKISQVSSMSRLTTIHKFCTRSGVTTGEEQMLFSDYLSVESAEIDSSAVLPTVPVVYKLSSALNQPKINMSTMPGGRETMLGKMGLTKDSVFFRGEKRAQSFAPKTRTSAIPDSVLNYRIAPNMSTRSAGMLSEAEWGGVLRNCGLMYGWVIDQTTNQIHRAPKAAFQLRRWPKDADAPLLPDDVFLPPSQDARPSRTGKIEDQTSRLVSDSQSTKLKSVLRLDPSTGGLMFGGVPQTGKSLPIASGLPVPDLGSSMRDRDKPPVVSSRDPPPPSFPGSTLRNDQVAAQGTLAEHIAGSVNGHGNAEPSLQAMISHSRVPRAKDEQPTGVQTLDRSEIVQDTDTQDADGYTRTWATEEPGELADGPMYALHSSEVAVDTNSKDLTGLPTGDSGEATSGNNIVQRDDLEESDLEDENDDGDAVNDPVQAREGDKMNEPGVDQAAGEPPGGLANPDDDDMLQQNSVQSTISDKVDTVDPSSDELKTALPSFVINDDSRIEVMVTTHEFETSMACNDFSASSTEASLAGGYSGFSLGVTYGSASKQSKSNKETQNTYQKTMIAKYLVPRADVYLNPEDLEPTPELRDMLQRIQTQRNIMDLRKLHRDFGQIFCRKATIGGRLLSRKTMSSQLDEKEQEEKEQFRTSVGVQLSTPVGAGAGMKHSSQTGKSRTGNQADNKEEEQNVFEAVGGNTILASNPLLWLPTVANPNNWRTINRDNMTSMSEFISAMPGWPTVRNDFIQAVSKLTTYYELPPTRELFLRFNVVAPTTQLSLAYLAKEPGAYRKPQYYLGHVPDSYVTPRELNIVHAHAFWGEISERTGVPPLFQPQSYRAPTIVGYGDVTSDHLAKGDMSSKNTVWKITAPFHEALQHGSRVIISTLPGTKSISLPDGEAGSKPAPAPASSLIVFRNQQGVFLPGMSSSDELQYWRILKKNGLYRGEHIKEGDEIRLCWAFADQTSGFRDFSQDVFGRRRNHLEDELKSVLLYMKLPWPRFESIARPSGKDEKAKGNSLLMSTVSDSKDSYENIRTVPAELRGGSGLAPVVVQDVCFHIDTVANNGLDDDGDYLFKSIDQTDIQDGLSAVAKLTHSALFL